MKPLYLENNRRTAVLLDGPALLVQRKGEADRLFPIQRLSRVVSDAGVAWDHRALLALMREDIPVIFHDGRGAVVGRMLGAGGERGALVLQLDELLSRPDGVSRYNDWCTHNSRQQLLALRRRHRWIGDCAEPERMQKQLMRKLERHIERQQAVVGIDHLRNRVFAWVTEQLAHLGIGAQTPHLTGGIIDLPTDLAGILQWRILIQWADMLDRYPAARRLFGRRCHSLRYLTGCYQRLEHRLEETGREVIARLHLWTATQDWP